jgi:dihydrofolate reductase
MQISLDGFIAGPDEDTSWIKTDDEEDWHYLFEMLESVDLLLLGRKMYPEYRDYWKKCLTDPGHSESEVAYAKFAEKTKHIVFSNTITNPGWENTEIVKAKAEDEVKKIKQQPGKDIYLVGGAKLASSLIAAGLVDEYRLVINPAIIGSGKSFFRDQNTKHLLKPVETKILTSGIIIAKYCEP